ncbi:MAG TPA: DoxX family membrane protein [Gemmatimonadaceae bacterium]|nr:DoxX family membrane protein [Gemmatimonadaceae bacterium]
MRIASWGHAAFAVTMIGLGILGLITGNFPPTWSGVPNGFPAREALAYLCAVVSLGTGIGLLFQRTGVGAARVLLVYFLLWLVLFRLSHFLFAPTALDTWWAPGDSGVMIAAAWVLYVWFTGDRADGRMSFVGGDNGLLIARIFYGLAMIPFGVAHFINLKGTVSVVPSWLPWHTAWAYFTGGAFIAAGVAVLLGVYARLAATLSAWQMGLFTLLVWIPPVVAGPNAGQWSEFVESVALTAGAWMVADSYRGVPWLALGKLRVPLVGAEPAR